MKKAVVLFSGGQDSTTCLFWALRKFDNVEAVSFNYGQMHLIELKFAQKIVKRLGITYKIFDVSNLLPNSSLINHTDHNKKSHINPDLPASFTAGRNILFLAVTGAYAADRKISDIVTGVCQTDYSGYPDCRRTTITAMENVLSLGYGAGDFLIHTPLMYLDKAETWKMAKDLNCLDVIINDTITDYNGTLEMNEWGRGALNNPASKLRAKGYYAAKEKGWL